MQAKSLGMSNNADFGCQQNVMVSSNTPKEPDVGKVKYNPNFIPLNPI
jgi:hypothetical protein